MRRWIGAIGLILAGVAGGFCLSRQLRLPPRSPRSLNHTGPSLESVQMLSALLSVKVELADVLEVRRSGYVGGMKVLLIVRGDFLLGVDLGTGRFEQVDPETRSAVLVLPPPQARSPRVDHGRSRLVAISSEGLWVIVPTDAGRCELISRAYAQAQRFIAAAAVDKGLIEKSRRQTEEVLGGFFRAMGWSVQIRWSDAAGKEGRQQDIGES